MGSQYNKVLKARRRKAAIKRKKAKLRDELPERRKAVRAARAAQAKAKA